MVLFHYFPDGLSGHKISGERRTQKHLSNVYFISLNAACPLDDWICFLHISKMKSFKVSLYIKVELYVSKSFSPSNVAKMCSAPKRKRTRHYSGLVAPPCLLTTPSPFSSLSSPHSSPLSALV